MNKLKIIFISSLMFIFSSIVCFADDTLDNNKSIQIPSEYKYVVYINDGGDYLFFNNYSVGKNNYVTFYDAQFYFMGTYMGRDNYGSSSVVRTNCKALAQEISVEYIDDGVDKVPPLVTPIVGGVEKIVPQLLEQLKKLLPTGVMLFAMLLGTQLVPRLIRLFQ